MIQDIPSKEDFFQAGSAYLNMAWERVVDFVDEPEDDASDFDHINRSILAESGINWEEIASRNEKAEKAEKIAYEDVMKRELSIAIGLALQGIEFILKGRIASVSPFLLLAGSSKDWPKDCRLNDVSYSAFRTVPAEDLPKIHDVVHKRRLSDSFTQRYNKLRLLRNKITHTVIKDLDIQCKDVLVDLLELALGLRRRKNWMELRLSYRHSCPNLEYAIAHHCYELGKVLHLFTPAECRRYFSVEKKRKKYYCYRCSSDSERDMIEVIPPLAHLEQATAKCLDMYCPVCVGTFQVVRKNCPDCEIKSAVFSPQGECLTCGFRASQKTL